MFVAVLRNLFPRRPRRLPRGRERATDFGRSRAIWIRAAAVGLSNRVSSTPTVKMAMSWVEDLNAAAKYKFKNRDDVTPGRRRRRTPRVFP